MKKIVSLILSMIMVLSLVGCSNNGEETVATVNGETITLGNYEKLLALNKTSMETYYGSEIWSTEIEKGKTYEDTLKDMVIESMTTSEVLYQEAKKQNVLPTDEEVQKEIDSFNESIKDDTEYQEELKKMGIDDEFLKYQFTRDLVDENLYAKYLEEVKIPESEMKAYYEDNKDTVTASHILLKTTDDDGNELSDDKKAELKAKMEEILAKAKAGEDFATLAKEYSECPSASEGGDLGSFGKGQMVKEFEDAAFSMEVGEISEIVESQYGYHIIKVTDKKEKSYDDMKDEIKSTLASEKYSEYVEKLKKDSTIEIKEDIVKSAKF